VPRGKTQETLDFIEACYDILEEIHPASVRAVAYQLFVQHLIPSMAKTCTNKVSTQLVYAREEGIIPWEWIVDEAREEERVLVWDDVDQCIRITQEDYRRDYWLEQRLRVAVWSEKGTVRGTLDPVLDEYQVPFLAIHGHNSATKTHEAAWLERHDRRTWVILYVGDWDPSGMDMSERDLPERLARYGGEILLRRVAIRGDDLASLAALGLTFDTRDKEEDARRKYANPGKKGQDSRRPWFEEHYGRMCCELDAMNPNVLRTRVRGAIEALIDRQAWDKMWAIEQVECNSLREVMSRWRASISGPATE
jgi:hypothetical protein